MSDISEVEELCVLLKLCIKRNTQPTTMKDLNKLYKDLSDSDLQKDVLKRGYSSIESFLKSRPKIFNIIRKSAGHNTIVTCEVGNDKFAGERSNSWNMFGNGDIASKSEGDGEFFGPVSDGGDDNDEHNSFCESINSKEILEEPSLNSSLTKSIDIVILEAYDPQRFWFVTQEHHIRIDVLLRSMTKYYNEARRPGERDHDAVGDLRTGDFVAVLYDTLWHRGKVLHQSSKNVKIFYIDFGTIETVDVSRIRKLRGKFYDAPIYLKRGTLFGINTELWSEDAKTFFKNLVMQKQLKAKINDYNESQRVYHLSVKFAENKLYKRLNDALCERNFCDYYFKLNSIADFDDIENGRDFTVTETPKFVEKNIEPISSLCKPNVENCRKIAEKKMKPEPEQSFAEYKFLQPVTNGIKKSFHLNSSGKIRQILPQSMAMFKVHSLKEIVIHSIDRATLDFKFFIKDELIGQFREFASEFNKTYQSKQIKCNDFTIENDVAVFHDNNYCRGRIESISQDGSIKVLLLDFGYSIVRPHQEVFKLNDEWMKLRSFIFCGTLDYEQSGIDYKTFKTITQNKIVTSKINGRIGSKVVLVVKELYEVTNNE